MYAGCVASAIKKDEYLGYIQELGFKNIVIQKEKPIVVPNDILINYLNEDEVAAYNASPNIIFSITVYAEKKEECCAPGSSCC